MIYGNDSIHEALEKVAGRERLGRITDSILRKAKAGKPVPPGLLDAHKRSGDKVFRSYGSGLFDPRSERVGKALTALMGPGVPPRLRNVSKDLALGANKVLKESGVVRGRKVNRGKVYEIQKGTTPRARRLRLDQLLRIQKTLTPATREHAAVIRRGLGHPSNSPRIRGLHRGLSLI